MQMEGCLGKTAGGRARKEREVARREDQLPDALQAEDAKRQKEQEMVAKAARDPAAASGSADARPGGEPSQVGQHAAPNSPVPHARVAPASGEPEMERFVMTPGAGVDNGNEGMEDNMSDQKGPII